MSIIYPFWILSFLRKISKVQVERAVTLFSLLLGLRYLYWRGIYTLNTQDALSWTISLVLYLAEIYGYLAVLLFYVQIAKPTNRSTRPPQGGELPTVDVLVTIYNESLDVLYRTLVGCAAMDYPVDRRRIYVLDDGHRNEVKHLAERLGCYYVTRPRREHAKAGNLNYGLSHSSGEFVMILDCDHVPVRTFLKETIGFFKDPKVAFVQTPHYFYNPDIFQRNLRLEREIVKEQDLFFYIIQPGRDGFNASFFAGSGGIFRRSALEEIGGFQTKTVTEDLHTSMILHSKGYKSVYLNKILSAGLAPESYRSYLKQRQRWTKGGIQIFVMDNPLFKKGLTLMQRINYLSSIFYFFHGWPRLVYLAVPLSYLLLGYPPLVAKLPVLLGYFLPYYITWHIAFNLISKGFRNPFWSDVYETVMCFSIGWTVIETLFRPKKFTFHTTPKGERFERPQLNWSHVMPHILLSALLTFGLGFGTYRLWHQASDFDAFWVSSFWSTYNLLILIAAIIVARERPQKRSSPRLFREIACDLSFPGHTLSGITSDLSETGLSLTLDRTTLLPPLVNIRLVSDFGEMTEIKGEVIRNDSLPSGRSNIGVRFVDLNDAQHQSLIRQMYSSPNSWQRVHEATAATWRSFVLLITSSTRAFIKEKALRRFSPRIKKRMVCEVVAGGRIFKGVTEDISNTGLSVHVETDEYLPREVIIQLYDNGRWVFSICGEIVRRKRSKGKGIVFGIRFLERKDLQLSSLL